MRKPETLKSIVEKLQDWKDRTALIAFEKDGSCRYTYAELAEAIEKMARRFQLNGVKKGDYVAILAPVTPSWIITCLSATVAGAIVVPLDYQLDHQTLTEILGILDVRFLCTTTQRADRLIHQSADPRNSIILLDAGAERDSRSWQSFGRDPDDKSVSEPPDLFENDVAAQFYTSGTTGTPKGVPLTHRNIMYQLQALMDLQLADDRDRVVLPLPLHHIYPFVIGMLYPLALGAQILIPESLTGPQLLRTIQAAEATAIIGVPRLYAALISAIERQVQVSKVASVLFELLLGFSTWMSEHWRLYVGKILFFPLHKKIGSHLRILACGGAAIDPQLARKLEGLGWPLIIGYGLTETSPLLTARLPGKGALNSVGWALPGVDLQIDVDSQLNKFDKANNGESEANTIGESEGNTSNQRDATGEVLARGPGVFSGYHRMPEQTARCFTKDGWFRTGDLGFFRGQDLHIIGRVSSLIVTSSGKKFDPEQLEQHYLENSVIKEIGVLQCADKLVAVVVPDMNEIAQRGGGDLSRLIHDAIDERSLHIATYKRLTGFVISPEPLQRTAMGKIQRHKLRERYTALFKGGVARGVLAVGDMDEADRKLLSHPVANIVWKYLIERYEGGKTTCLSLDSTLQLDLGIDSLEWVSLTLNIPHLIGKEINETAISRISTVRELLQEVIKLDTSQETVETSPSHNALATPDDWLTDEQLRWLKPLDRSERSMQRLLYMFVKLIVSVLFRPEVTGLQGIPRDKPLVFIPNHASYIDAGVLAAALPFDSLSRLHWAGFTGISFKTAFRRAICRLVRAIPIDPDRAALSSLAFASAVLQRNESLVWFPEGRRTLTGKLQPFKGGIGVLLEHFPDAIVVPVFLKDTGKALPPGSCFIKPIKLQVIFGKPTTSIDLIDGQSGKPIHDLIVSALYDAVLRLDPNGDKTSAEQNSLRDTRSQPSQ
ncbi:MAG TPA: AMP-binding protein [Oculatellaceae cyanobacterium]